MTTYLRTGLKNRSTRFFVEDGCLLRTVASAADDGRSYTKRCTRDTFQQVAWAIQNLPQEGQRLPIAALARRENLPFTQVDVAMEFLRDRGIVELHRRRRCYAATASPHLDAMAEFHALAEQPRSA